MILLGVSMMFKIAICDDDRFILEQLENIIDKNCNQWSEKVVLETFSEGKTLWQCLSDGIRFDMIFLDIKMNELNGVDLGRLIREELHDDLTQIAYISNQSGYAMDLFSVRPIDFLVKPLQAEQVLIKIRQVMALLEKDNRYFEYATGRDRFRLPYKDILYFSSNGRRITITTIHGDFQYNGKLSAVEDKLCGQSFIAIHKSYIVNYRHIIKAEPYQLILSDGVILPISQSKRREVTRWLVACEEEERKQWS